MKSCLLLLMLSLIHSADEFYRVVVQEPNQHGGTYTYMGKISGGMATVQNNMKSGDLIEVNELRAWTGDKMTLWIEYDKTSSGTIFINPKFITTIMPLKSDPLLVEGDKKALF